MELFSLGVGHYSEKDIQEGARAQLASPAMVRARIQRDIQEQIDEANADRGKPMYDRDMEPTIYD